MRQQYVNALSAMALAFHTTDFAHLGWQFAGMVVREAAVLCSRTFLQPTSGNYG